MDASDGRIAQALIGMLVFVAACGSGDRASGWRPSADGGSGAGESAAELRGGHFSMHGKTEGRLWVDVSGDSFVRQANGEAWQAVDDSYPFVQHDGAFYAARGSRLLRRDAADEPWREVEVEGLHPTRAVDPAIGELSAGAGKLWAVLASEYFSQFDSDGERFLAYSADGGKHWNRVRSAETLRSYVVASGLLVANFAESGASEQTIESVASSQLDGEWESTEFPVSDVTLFERSGEFFAGTSAGPKLWRLESGGRDWRDVTPEGLDHAIVDTAGDAPTYAVDGTGRVGKLLDEDGGVVWEPIPRPFPNQGNADDAYLDATQFISPQRFELVRFDGKLLLMTWEDGIWRYRADTDAWENIGPSGYTGSALLASSEGLTLVGSSRLHVNRGTQEDSWREVDFGSKRVGTLVSFAQSESAMLVATSRGYILRSTDGGESWSTSEMSLLALRPDDAVATTRAWEHVYLAGSGETVYAGFHGGRPDATQGADSVPRVLAGGGLFRSTDGGRTWEHAGDEVESITNRSQGVNGPSNSLVNVRFLAVDGKEFVLGTVRGVFSKAPGDSKWRLSERGLPDGLSRPKLGSGSVVSVDGRIVGGAVSQDRDTGNVFQSIHAWDGESKRWKQIVRQKLSNNGALMGQFVSHADTVFSFNNSAIYRLGRLDQLAESSTLEPEIVVESPDAAIDDIAVTDDQFMYYAGAQIHRSAR